MKKYTILVFAQNRRGVLERIAMLIRKKMYNLEQITASDTQTEDIKRLTISFSYKESAKIPQIISQINKIIEVIEVKLVDNDSAVQREAGLVKIKRPDNLSEIISIVQIFEAKVVHMTKQDLIIETIGSPEKINHFISILEPYHILELGRSGAVAMEKI
jgi:acetolactate synthase-1/3 small subunit